MMCLYRSNPPGMRRYGIPPPWATPSDAAVPGAPRPGFVPGGVPGMLPGTGAAVPPHMNPQMQSAPPPAASVTPTGPIGSFPPPEAPTTNPEDPTAQKKLADLGLVYQDDLISMVWHMFGSSKYPRRHALTPLCVFSCKQEEKRALRPNYRYKPAQSSLLAAAE